MKTIIFALSIVILATLLSSQTIQAQETLESNRYKLEFGPYTIGSPTTADTKPQGNTGGKSTETLSWVDFIVRSGFPQNTSTEPFGLTLNPTSMNLQSAQPEIPLLVSSDVSLNLGSARGYDLTIISDNPPTSTRGKIIPYTTCDDANKPCTLSMAQRWIKSNYFGFGYNVSADDAPVDFRSDEYYRPLPDLSKGEEPVAILSGEMVSGSRKGKISYKTLISADQPAGVYANTIYIQALPRY